MTQQCVQNAIFLYSGCQDKFKHVVNNVLWSSERSEIIIYNKLGTNVNSCKSISQKFSNANPVNKHLSNFVPTTSQHQQSMKTSANAGNSALSTDNASENAYNFPVDDQNQSDPTLMPFEEWLNHVPVVACYGQLCS